LRIDGASQDKNKKNKSDVIRRSLTLNDPS
jgi:hypothetical protein